MMKMMNVISRGAFVANAGAEGLLSGVETRIGHHRRSGSCLKPLALLLTFPLLVGCGSNGVTPASVATTQQTTASVAASVSATASADPFLGEWDTGPYPFRNVRAAIIAAGVTDKDLKGFVRGVGMTDAARWEFHLSFYQAEGGPPYAVASGWNPDKGGLSGGDHGPYQLLPHHRILFQFDNVLMSYQLSGDRLIMHFIRNTDPSATPAQLRQDAPYSIAWAAAPLIKVKS